jgi:peptidyl-prolyl cis-trans isomerase SurA
MRAPFRLALSLAALSAATAALAPPAHAVIVERIVAVIGDKPILMSELNRRAIPYLTQMHRQVPPGPQRNVAQSQINKQLLNKMIDDELESQAADKAKVHVTSDEVDNALRNLAQSQNITLTDLLKGATASGMTEQDYRDEIRRQILEGKMLQLRVKGRVRITEEDVKAMYEKTLREERKHLQYRPAWIVLRILPGSSGAAIAERQALAKEIVKRARAGEDFAGLAKGYSDDTPTREIGGDLGIRAPHGTEPAKTGKRPTLAPELENAVMNVDNGQVTDPIKVGEAIVILKLLERQASTVPAYEQAKPHMLNRLQGEILDKAKRKWLDELKSRTHLDVRL